MRMGSGHAVEAQITGGEEVLSTLSIIGNIVLIALICAKAREQPNDRTY